MAFNVCACVRWKIIIFVNLWKGVYMLPNTDNVTLAIIDNVSVKDLSSCEEGWKPHDQYCFKLFSSVLDWMDASNACKSLGGHLASIHSKEQNDFIETFYNGGYGVMLWIGLRDHDLDGIFVWHDETDVTYTNWHPGEPYGNYTSGDCVELYLSKIRLFQFGKWLVFKCEQELPYMCQKKSTSLTSRKNLDNINVTKSAFTSSNIDSETIHILPNTVVDDVPEKDFSSCEEGWKPHDQYCFKLFNRYLNWTDASNACKILDGHLASIHSKEQNDFIETFYKGYHGVLFWIGLRDHESDGIFVWHDETDVTYTNWNPGEPKGKYTSVDCVELYLSKSGFFQFGKWRVIHCERALPYMCQKKFATSAITSSTIDSETIATSSITSTFIDDETSSISVIAFVITLLTVIVFLVLMGGIAYNKRHWLEEKRLKIFYRRAEGPTSTEPYTKLVLEPKLTII